LFGAEVERMRRGIGIQPTDVANPNDAEVLESIEAMQPFFILTLGGALYSRRLIASARGIALNQHDGWCPDYRGSYTVDWTLFHRDYRKLGSTVHVLTSGMDAGAIVRRSETCLTEDDNRHRTFLRTVALGTDLMCEAVENTMATGYIDLHDQPDYQGQTFLRHETTDDVIRGVESDVANGVFSSGLRALRDV
jgi:methionyl-tRNA formyltransferase